MVKLFSEVYGEWCETAIDGNCTACTSDANTKTALIHGVCKECSSVFGQNCLDCNSFSCTNCADGFALINGVCVPPGVAFGEQCAAIIDSNKSQCGKTDKGYFVDKISGRAVICSVLPEEPRTSCCSSISDDTERNECMGQSTFVTQTIKVMYNDEVYEVMKGAVVPVNCKEFDNVCTACDDGYVLYGGSCIDQCNENEFLFDGECKSCGEVYGDSCSSCSLTSCSSCSSGVLFHGSCFACNEFTVHCSECSSVDTCTACSDDLVASNNTCVTKADECKKFGEGCLECSDDQCTNCVADDCCGENKQIIVKSGSYSCDTCDSLVKNCVTCSSTECLGCISGMALDAGECKSCSVLFDGCSLCDASECKNCSDPAFILTPNGCYYDEPSSSSSKISSSRVIVSSSVGISEQSKPLSSSEESNDSNAGMIAGIVIGVVAIVAIAAVAIYCIASSGSKYGKIDPSISEPGDAEMKTMSIL